MARRDNKETTRARQVPFNLMDLEPSEEDDDTTVAGHIMLRQQRQLLYHMRLIEHEMPKLVGGSAEHMPFELLSAVLVKLGACVQLLGNPSSHLHPKPPSSSARYPTEAKNTL